MGKPTLPQLYNAKTGEPMTVEPDQVQRAIASGEAAYLKGDEIPVISPDGTPGTIPAEEARQAFSAGYKLEPLESIQHRSDKKEYGDGLGSDLAAGALATARGVSLGLSDLALTQSGAVSPETIEKYREHNPNIDLAGNVAGAVLPAVLTAGASAPASTVGIAKSAASLLPSAMVAKVGTNVAASVAKKLGSEGAQSLAKKIAIGSVSTGAGSAVEGAFFGAGNSISEAALGDPNAAAERATAEVGLGALIGGAAGMVLGGVAPVASKILDRFNADSKAIQKAALADDIKETATQGFAKQADELTPAAAVEPTGAPQTLDEISARVKRGNYQGLSPELPEKAVLEDSIRILDGELEYKPHRLQMASLEDAKSRDLYKTVLEYQSEESANLVAYEALQKAEAVGKTHATVKHLAEGYAPTGNATESGNRAVKTFVDQYGAEKKALAPIFKKFDEISAGTRANPNEIIGALDNAMPGAGRYFTVDANEGIKLLKYSKEMPFSRNTYGALKDLADAANNPNLTLAELRNVRETLRDRLAFGKAADRDYGHIGALRKGIMDYMEASVAKALPDESVRETFKRYAINQQHRELIEKVFGGSLSDHASILKQIKPEEVVDRIFRNTATVKAAREILGEEKFKRILADHLMEQIQRVTDKGSFSSNKFATFLKSNQDVLREAFAGKEQPLIKLRALADYMRILPDSPSINPSGTAKTLTIMGTVAKIGKALGDPSQFLGDAMKNLTARAQKQETLAQVDNILAGGKNSPQVTARAKAYSGLKNLEEASQKVTRTISAGIRAFLSTKGAMAAVPASMSAMHYSVGGKKDRSSKTEKRDVYIRRLKEIQDVASNPEGFSELVASRIKGVSEVAPQTATAMVATAVKGAQFLYEKAPKNPHSGFTLMPHKSKWEPSDAELSKWTRYLTAVDDPMSILKDLKHGMLTREAVESVKTVYPKLYGEITSELLERLSEHDDDIPFQKRLQLGILLDSPTEKATDPKFIASMQALHAQEQPQEAQNQGSVPAGRAQAMELANGAKSQTERVLTRA